MYSKDFHIKIINLISMNSIYVQNKIYKSYFWGFGAYIVLINTFLYQCILV
jgi:hypothetical protein